MNDEDKARVSIFGIGEKMALNSCARGVSRARQAVESFRNQLLDTEPVSRKARHVAGAVSLALEALDDAWVRLDDANRFAAEKRFDQRNHQREETTMKAGQTKEQGKTRMLRRVDETLHDLGFVTLNKQQKKVALEQERVVNSNSVAAPTKVLTTADLRLAKKQNALADLIAIAGQLGGLNDPDIDQLLVAPLAALRAEIAKG